MLWEALSGALIAWFVATMQLQSYRCKNRLGHLLFLFITDLFSTGAFCSFHLSLRGEVLT